MSERIARPGIEPPEELRPRVGISLCLLGEPVRMNGGHSRNRFLVEELGTHVEWVPVCPEMEMGLGAPRPVMRIARDSQDDHRLIVTESGEDLTDRMTEYSEGRVAELATERLDGFVLKKDSPSCGAFRVKVYDRNGSPSKIGEGFFAKELMQEMPDLPVEEEGRLNDPVLREHFVVRIYTQARWRSLCENDPTPRGLVRFHSAHKMLFLAHSPEGTTRLGRIVAEAGARPWDEVATDYEHVMNEVLAQRPSRGRHVNTMQHLMGFLKQHISADAKAELTRLFQRYRSSYVPIVVPLTLLGHHLRAHRPHAWAERQVYLEPYPEDLMLRNV